MTIREIRCLLSYTEIAPNDRIHETYSISLSTWSLQTTNIRDMLCPSVLRGRPTLLAFMEIVPSDYTQDVFSVCMEISLNDHRHEICSVCPCYMADVLYFPLWRSSQATTHRMYSLCLEISLDSHRHETSSVFLHGDYSKWSYTCYVLYLPFLQDHPHVVRMLRFMF